MDTLSVLRSDLLTISSNIIISSIINKRVKAWPVYTVKTYIHIHTYSLSLYVFVKCVIEFGDNFN